MWGVEWDVADENLDLGSLELAYSINNDQRWIPLPLGTPAARGKRTWNLPEEIFIVAVGMKARDKAGNEAHTSIVLRPGEGDARDAAKAPPRENVRYVNSRRFELDFEVENVGKSKLKAVEIWFTPDNGRTWTTYKEVSPPQGPFDVEVARDGWFGFKLVAVSGAGLAGPRPREGDKPDLYVQVVTTKPEVQIVGADLKPGDGPGKLTLRWQVTDKNKIDAAKVSYAESPIGPWKAIEQNVVPYGPLEWEIPKGAPYQLYFRVECRDQAGNIGSAVTPNPVALDFQVPKVRLKGVKAKQANPER